MSAGKADELQLMQARLDALYLHDERARMTAINQWDGGRVPRFHLGRTAAGNLWRFRFDVPDALAAEIAEFCETEPVATATNAPPVHKHTYVRLLNQHLPVEASWAGPAYRFPDTLQAVGADVTAITEDNAQLLEGGMDDWLPDVPHRAPFMVVVAGGRAVSVCASARITAAAHEAGVETVPDARQRGCAGSAVSAWAAAVRARGAIPFYSTSWDNVASQGVARSLGLTMIGTDFQLI